MTTFILPGIMNHGILSQTNQATSATAKRIWKDSFLGDDARGFLHLAKSGNAQTSFIGNEDVTTVAADNDQGLPMVANDVLVGEVVGRTSRRIFNRSTVASDSFLTLEVG